VALEIFGDPWTLLIIRDLMFKRRRSFREFEAGGERIATNILADRLERLEAAGIIRRGPDPADGRRVIYGLTAKGADLAPVLIEVILWSAKHERTAAPPTEVSAMKRRRAHLIATIRSEWR
jgi:DNA-binding HxlR family transcriptional regulator